MGNLLKKPIFLVLKYGYVDSDNVSHSTFSGVERNSLSWNEIEQIANGFTLVKASPIRFYKNFNNLNITIKNQLKTSIEFNTRKLYLIINIYQPS